MRKFLASLLTVVMLLSLAVPTVAAATTKKEKDKESITIAGTVGIQTDKTEPGTNVDYSKFKDVKGHWAGGQLEWAVKNGLMNGVTSTQMNPDAGITRAQMAAMIVRAFGATKAGDISMLTDVKKDDWCYDYIGRAVQMGCLTTFGNAVQQSEVVTREEVAMTIVKAAGYTVLGDASLRGYSDWQQVTEAYRPYLATAIANGVMAGYQDKTLRPKAKITRAQFAVMMNRMASAHMTKIATYSSKNVEGSLLVGLPGIELNDTYVTKNLFLSDGCGNGTLKLNGTTVDGTAYIRGGSKVLVENGSRMAGVTLVNPNNAVALEVDDSSRVGYVNVQNAVSGATLTGRIGDVNVLTGKGAVKLVNASTGTVTLASKLAAVSVDKNSEMESLVVGRGATGAEVDFNGTAEEVEVAANDSTIKINGTVDTLSFGDGVEDCALSVGNDAKLDNVDLAVDEVKLTLSGDMSKLRMDGSEQEVKLGGDSNVKRVDVDGEDSSIEFTSGSETKNVYTTGDDLELTGSGTVEKITVNDGDGVHISVPGAEVYNKGGKNVYVGEYKVAKGEKVTVNDKGDGIVTDEEDKNNSGSGSNSGNNGGNSGSGNNGGNSGGSGGGSGSGGSGGGGVYTVTLSPAGGSVTPEYVRTDSDGIVPTLPEPTREGYTFTGWFTDARAGSAVLTGDKVTKSLTLYAHWTTNSGTGEIIGQTTNVTMNAATAAMPSDLGFGSKYNYNMFGAAQSVNENEGKLIGTVYYLSTFDWFTGENAALATGYYMPIIVKPQAPESEDEVLIVGGRTYTHEEMRSKGTGYKGEIICFFNLDPNATPKSIAWSYDPDGDGTYYAPTTGELDYSDVKFRGGTADDSHYKDVRPVDGVDGAETATMTSRSTDDVNYNITLTTENLLETKKDGRYGYWTGLVLPAYDDAQFLKITEKSPTGAGGVSTQPVLIDGERGIRYASWYVDASNKKLGSGAEKGIYTITLEWMVDADTPTAHEKAKFIVDLKGCMLAGEKLPDGAKPCVSNTTSQLMTAQEVTQQFGLNIDDIGINMRLANDVIGGTFLKVQGTTGGAVAGSELNGYYLPVKINATAAQGPTSIEVTRDAGKSVAYSTTKADSQGRFTVYALLEMNTIASSFEDTQIIFKAQPASDIFTDVKLTFNGSNAQTTDATILLSSEIPKGTVGDIATTQMWKDESDGGNTYNVFFNSLTVHGVIGLQEDVTLYEKTYKRLWCVPVNVRVRAVAGEDWTLVVSGTGSDGTTTFGTFTKSNFDASGYMNIAVPLAYGKTIYSTIDLVLQDANGTIDSATISCSGTLDGYDASFEEETAGPDEPESPAGPVAPEGVSVEAVTDSEFIAKYMSKGYAITAETPTTVVGADGAYQIAGTALRIDSAPAVGETETRQVWCVPVSVNCDVEGVTHWTVVATMDTSESGGGSVEFNAGLIEAAGGNTVNWPMPIALAQSGDNPSQDTVLLPMWLYVLDMTGKTIDQIGEGQILAQYHFAGTDSLVLDAFDDGTNEVVTPTGFSVLAGDSTWSSPTGVDESGTPTSVSSTDFIIYDNGGTPVPYTIEEADGYAKITARAKAINGLTSGGNSGWSTFLPVTIKVTVPEGADATKLKYVVKATGCDFVTGSKVEGEVECSSTIELTGSEVKGLIRLSKCFGEDSAPTSVSGSLELYATRSDASSGTATPITKWSLLEEFETTADGDSGVVQYVNITPITMEHGSDAPTY